LAGASLGNESASARGRWGPPGSPVYIGKNVFHLIGLNKCGAIVLRQKLSRGKVEAGLTNC
jgi:hypothetical protein